MWWSPVREHTFRVGLLFIKTRVLGVCFKTSAGVTGDGKAGEGTLTFEESMFSWELGGSIASLLGTGVIVDRLGLARKLVLVDSFRHVGEGSASLGAVGVDLTADPLLKKPRMLCCLPPDAEPAAFFCADGVLAGVLAAIGVRFDMIPLGWDPGARAPG